MSKVILTGRIAKRPRASLHRRVEEQIRGLELAVEAARRNRGDLAAAEAWLSNAWRSAPDARELVIRAVALVHVRAMSEQALNVELLS